MTVETFFANFGHLADAPNGVQKLRELILQLAVQGKLLSQDPNDEPASILIGKVLNKNGKSLLLENEPFLLPGTWLWVKLGDISVIERGGSPRPIKDYITDDPEGLNWIKIGDTDIGGKYISSSREKIRKEGLKKTRMVYPGDFLLTNSMSFGRPYITKIEGCIHDGWLRIHPPEILDKDYLYNLLSTPYVAMFFKGAASGAVVLNLNKGKVRELPIPIPPLEEQKRIVAKVDQLMVLCDELEARQKKQQQGRVRLNNSSLDALLTAREPIEFADHWQRISTNFDLLYDHPETIAKLRAAILQLAIQGKLVPQDSNDEPASVLLERIKAEKERLVKVGEIKAPKKVPVMSNEEIPFKLPANWAWARLSGLTEVITKGSSPKWQGVQYVDSGQGILFITSENVGSFGLRLDKKKYVESSFNEIEPRSILRKGDVLMNIVGASIGRTAVYDIDDTANINQAVCLIRFAGQGALNYLRYFLTFFNTPTCISYMFNKQVDNARANLSMGNIAKFTIPIPPLEEQKRIVAKVEQLMSLCDELETTLNQAQQQSEKLMEATVRQLLVA